MKVVIAAVVVVALVALSVWAAKRVRHPENTASHAQDPRESTSERLYSDTDRPAGPDAEDPDGGLHRRPGN